MHFLVRHHFLLVLKQLWTEYYIGEINILGLNDVSWWHGFLHQGQFLLSVLLQPQICWAIEPFEACVDSLILLQNGHIVLAIPVDPSPPQISHVFISPIIYRDYW